MKVKLILLISSLCLIVGITISYYNTASLGYDNKTVVSVSDSSIKVLDFDIKYENIKEKGRRFLNSLPDNYFTI